MYVGVHGGLKFMSDVFLDLSLYLLRHGLFFTWNSPILANLASQLALGIPCLCLLKCWDYRWLPHLPSSYVVSGNPNSGS